MNILLSNDDGLMANGIRALTEALSCEHDVYVIAPDRERSAAGHSLTLHTPLRVEELEPKFGAKRNWVTTGTPGDCVKIGLSAILEPHEMPDLVISGINHGPNLGADILYSGTVSCALEGAMLGFPAIATSLAGLHYEVENFAFAANFMAKFVHKIKEINFPQNLSSTSTSLRWKKKISPVLLSQNSVQECSQANMTNVLTREAKHTTGLQAN